MIPVHINGKTYHVQRHQTILEACRQVGVYVPSLCYHSDIPATGACGLCVVKINGSGYCYSCMTEVEENMTIDSEAPDVLTKTREALNTFLGKTSPPKSQEIEDLLNYLHDKSGQRLRNYEKTPALIFDPKECISCTRCVSMCADVMSINALDDNSMPIKVGNCIACGQCIKVCPTKALTDPSHISSVLKALAAGKTLVMVVDGAVKVSAGEMLGDQVGCIVTPKIVGAARTLGFRHVFDAGVGVDLSLMLTVDELEKRMGRNENLPLLVSNCPAFVNMIERMHPELQKNLMAIRSPHGMLARIIKNRMGIQSPRDRIFNHSPRDRIASQSDDLFVVALTGCTAAKSEISRMQMSGDVDAVLTVREFVKMVKNFGIEWLTVKGSDFDKPFDVCSSQANLTSVSGGHVLGVISILQQRNGEASTDTGLKKKLETGKNVVKHTVTIGGTQYKVAICNSFGAQQLLRSGDYKLFDFVEVMVCPGGCINGGGQPKLQARSLTLQRQANVHRLAERNKIKVPVESPECMRLYQMIENKENGVLQAVKTFFEPQESAMSPVIRRRNMGIPIVAYGSVHGACVRYARLVAAFMNCSSCSMNQIDSLDTLVKRKTVVFVCSTYKGQFPRNAIAFVNMLKQSTADLSQVNFAVLGVGSSKYGLKFGAAGRKLFSLLEEKGAKPIIPLAICDEQAKEGGKHQYIEFSRDLAAALYVKRPMIGTQPLSSLIRCQDTSILEKPARPIGFEIAEMVESEVISKEGELPAMHRYLIKLPEGMTYEAGDHATILPTNDEPVVNRVLEALKYDPDSVYSVQPCPCNEKNLIPQKVSVRQLFTQYLDLNGAPPKALLKVFYDVADEDGKAKIDPLINGEDDKAYTQYLKDINVAEVIEEFAKHGIPSLDNLVCAIPHTLPRIFSVASAPEANRGYLELIVFDVLFGPNNKRYGLCTHFLARPDLRYLPIYCMRGIFRYPKDPSTPIIMIACGGGISPMFSLIQYRMASKEEVGPAYLFFGSKYRGAYPLLNIKLDRFVQSGIIQEAYRAFSREGPKKKYVQDLILEASASVWKLWKDPKTQVFYCGPARQVPEQLKEIFLNITITEGRLSRDDAVALNNRHIWHIEEYTTISS